MTERTFALGVLLFAGGLWWLWGIVAAWHARRQLAGVRIVTCPETGTHEAVTFDRRHAAVTALVHDEPEVQLNSCSRWGERGACEQPCLSEALSPDATAEHLVSQWAEGKHCVYCRKPLHEAPFVGHHVALRAQDGVTTEWPDVPANHLTEALESDLPVCWDCHVVETFRRVYPELVTDR